MSRVALVTGAGGPFGSALCRLLLTRGYHVVAVYRTRLPGVDSQLARLVPFEGIFAPIDNEARKQSEGAAAFAVRADLGVRAEISRIVDLCVARYDSVDVLINAAADVRYHGRITEMADGDGAEGQQLAINVVAPALLASEIFLRLWKHDPVSNFDNNRNVVNISSISGLVVDRMEGQGFYAATKAALNMVTLYQAAELADYCVRVNALCPSRWSTPAQLDRVLTAVMDLADGSETGQVL